MGSSGRPLFGFRQAIFAVSLVHSAEGPQIGWNSAVFKLGASVENSVHIQTGTSQTNMKDEVVLGVGYGCNAGKLFDYRDLGSYSQFT